MTDPRITYPTWGRKLKMAQDAERATRTHLNSANTPGMKHYWERIHAAAKLKVDELTAFINNNPGIENEEARNG